MAALLLLLWLGAARGVRASPQPVLSIQPEAPLVERGGTIRINCSLACPGGKVQWEGLDTDMGDVAGEGASSSVLTFAHAATGMGGLKLCTAKCRGRSLEKRAQLQVYSFPDALRLDSWPEALVAGRPARLSCSLSHVYPSGSLKLLWFRGEEALPSPELGEDAMEGFEEQLFRYRSVLEVPQVAEGAAYRCCAVLSLKRRTFRRESAAAVGRKGTPEPRPRTTDGPPTPSLVEGRSPAATPAPPTPPPSPAKTSGPSSASTETSTPGPPTPGTTSPPASLATHRGHTDITLWPSPSRRTSAGTPALPPAAKPTLDTPGPSPPDSTTSGGLCHPVISLDPPQGAAGEALAITCQALDCGEAVRWVQTPAAPSQYREEDTEGRSTLRVSRLGREHQGIYRCATAAGLSRAINLHSVTSAGQIHAMVAVGTTGSLLGLAIAGYVSHRLRRK